ncbi:MAG: hypothetical protein ACE5JI_22730 [Acidobacteriota bacterium]
MKNFLIKLRLKEISLVDKAMNPGAKAVFAKRDEPDNGLLAKVKRLLVRKQGENEMTLEEVLAKLADDEKAVVLAAIEEAAKKAEPQPQPQPAPEIPAELAKNLPPSVKKALDEAAELKKSNAEFAKRVDAMEDADKLRGFVAKAAEFESLAGMSTDELGSVLKAASESLSAELYKKLEDSLGSAAEAVRKSAILEELGSSGRGVEPKTGDTEAQAKIRTIAKGYMDKDPELSELRAMNKAWEKNPDLYTQHRAEINKAMQ